MIKRPITTAVTTTISVIKGFFLVWYFTFGFFCKVCEEVLSGLGVRDLRFLESKGLLDVERRGVDCSGVLFSSMIVAMKSSTLSSSGYSFGLCFK